MVFLLNRDNVLSYLADLGYQSEKSSDNIEPLAAKNFNLLITLSDKLKLLVKQERHNHQGKAAGEFLGEWQINGLIQDFPDLKYWQPFLSSIRHFDRENSILVFEYLQEYRDLMDFHLKENTYPQSIEESLNLAMTPLDRVQPSIAALTRAYLSGFPQILIDRPDFIQRAVQFAGLAVIQGILAEIDYQKTLENSGICQLQVAKSLLCRPIQSMPTVFGTLEFMPQMAAIA